MPDADWRKVIKRRISNQPSAALQFLWSDLLLILGLRKIGLSHIYQHKPTEYHHKFGDEGADASEQVHPLQESKLQADHAHGQGQESNDNEEEPNGRPEYLIL